MPARPPVEVIEEQARRQVLARLQQADAMLHSLGFFSRLTATMAETGEDRQAAQPRRAA